MKDRIRVGRAERQASSPIQCACCAIPTPQRASQPAPPKWGFFVGPGLIISPPPHTHIHTHLTNSTATFTACGRGSEAATTAMDVVSHATSGNLLGGTHRIMGSGLHHPTLSCVGLAPA